MCDTCARGWGVKGRFGEGVQVLGSGSEMILDVAPGMDWTAACGIMMVTEQARPLSPHLLLCDSVSSVHLCNRATYACYICMCVCVLLRVCGTLALAYPCTWPPL